MFGIEGIKTLYIYICKLKKIKIYKNRPLQAQTMSYLILNLCIIKNSADLDWISIE